MLKDSLNVYCDMETTPKEGWTLLVSSNTNGWKGNQVTRHYFDVHTTLYGRYGRWMDVVLTDVVCQLSS